MINSIENLTSETARRILLEAKNSGVSVEDYLEEIANESLLKNVENLLNGDESQVRTVSEKIDLSESHEWLKENRQKYIGKWVVLDGGRLIGAGYDPRPFVEQARKDGVKIPFVKFVEDDREPFTGGWF